MRYRLKICCIRDLDEAFTALRLGATHLGLVSAMPSGPGPIPEERIAEIAAAVPRDVTTVLLTSEASAAAIAAQHARCGTRAIQIVDALPDGELRALRALVPNVELIQVVHVTGPAAIDEARRAEPFADAILLDSGTPLAAVKELGGTGRVHDWAVSRAIVEAVRRPVFLAGGLRADNLREAVRRVDPFGVDVCSGVRTGGRLDEEKLRALGAALAAAARDLQGPT